MLDLIVVDYLFSRFPDSREGELSKLKSMLVRGRSLQKIAREMKLGDYILMSDNEARSGGRGRSSILENTFEAIVAALYLDGGNKTARRFITRRVLSQVDDIASRSEDYNYKSQLLEYAQANGLSAPIYRVITEIGPDHARHFEIEVSLGDKPLGRGNGRSKKAAQQQAARVAMELLNKQSEFDPSS